MAINIQNIITALEAKVAAATSATETQELIVLIKTIKASGQQTVSTYATVSSLPTASADNEGNIAYVASESKLYFSDGSVWAAIGTGTGGGTGGGTAYDQSLNTTDDVVFDSALIGDVSIIANEIAGLNSYGLPSELNIVSDLNVGKPAPGKVYNFSSFGSPSGVSIYAWSENLVSLIENGAVNPTSDFAKALIALQTGDTFVLSNGTTSATITVVSKGGSYATFGGYIFDFTVDKTVGAAGFGAAYPTTMQIGELPIIKNLNVTGAIRINGEDVTLTPNVDGSKSVIVDTTNTTSETVTVEPGSTSAFVLYGDPSPYGGPVFRYNAMAGSSWTGASKFKTGTQITLVDSMSGSTHVFKLTADMNYSMMNSWTAPYVVISGGSIFGEKYASTVITSVSSGSVSEYQFTETGFVADAALIGDVSIVNNEIAAVDSYGNPSSLVLNAPIVEVPNDLTLSINSFSSVQEVIQGGMSNFRIEGSPTPSFSYNGGSIWSDAPKFKAGTIVSLTDSMSSTTVVFRLTTDMTNMAGWYASYTIISGNVSGSLTANQVTITSETGSIANYGFDSDGTFTAPSVNTTSLLINGSEAAVLDKNLDGSRSVIVPATTYGNPQDITDNMNSFYINTSGLFTYSNFNPSWVDAIKFKSGVRVQLTDQMSFSNHLIELTSDFNYDYMDNRWEATYKVISGGAITGMDKYNTKVTVTTINPDIEYQFTEDGLIADAALIGDVSIVGNTISSVAADAYGLQEALIIDGNLDINNDVEVSQVYSYGSANGQLETYPTWNGKTLTWAGYTPAMSTIIQSLKVGDKIIFTDNLSYQQRTVTLASAFSYQSVTFIASTVETEPTGMGLGANTSNPLTVTTTITKTSSFTSDGLTVDGYVDADSFKVVGNDGSGNQPYTQVMAGNLVVASDDSGYATRTTLSPANSVNIAVYPGTLADGGVVDRLTIGRKTGGTLPNALQIPLSSAASLNGDISIIEVVVSAINVVGTPLVAYAKSWKVRGYAIKVNNSTTFTQIGTTEILADTSGINGAGLEVTLNVSNGVVNLNLGDPVLTGSGYEWTWGGEVTVITSHVFVPTSGGGGGK